MGSGESDAVKPHPDCKAAHLTISYRRAHPIIIEAFPYGEVGHGCMPTCAACAGREDDPEEPQEPPVL